MTPFGKPGPGATKAVAMVHAFFDETGTPSAKDGVFILAGFVAGLHRWVAFLEAWSAVAHNHQIQEIHTTDFLNNQGQHKSDEFDYQERLGVLREFAEVVRNHAAGAIAVGVDCAAYREIMADGPKHVTADVFCMQQTLAETHRIMREVSLPNQPLELSFAQSDAYSPRILSAWLTLKRRKKGLPRNLMATITFGDPHYVPALQAADMLSCGINRELRASPDKQWLADSPFSLLVSSPEQSIPFNFHFWSADELRRRKDEVIAAARHNS